ncbi:MAG: cbb3-type cytochrome c oxidase subunit II [Leptospiraceae bacterium]|nr:cbb3-type cytochrome c oxidase subunit II [Leptospiraceae bacterium]MCB1315673.1 cbb3-type cytochrome c oxidase subunit II [Leptospiraceae bacterium]MCB1320477.1 cbb3-type cytochrome c oxidase subunit II [Leptospiraceae bacterium]
MLEKLTADPIKLTVATILVTALLSALVVWWPFESQGSHGSLAMLTPESPLVLKGQEVYFQEGCQYCHTQQMRPIQSEVQRFADVNQYGYLGVLPSNMEYYYETPAMRGSRRIGPDLSRVAHMSQSELKSVLTGAQEGSLAAAYHNYAHLFECESGMNPLFLSWKIRMMMQLQTPYSDPYQKSVVWALEEQTRGDALLAYLQSLGKKQLEFAGKFYAK